MDSLDHLSDEQLAAFFCCNKTKMSCMEEPQMFLNQLRDFKLVPENLYLKVMNTDCKEKRQEGLYSILDFLEKNQKQSIKVFWECVFQEHILQKYSTLRSLKESLHNGAARENTQSIKQSSRKGSTDTTTSIQKNILKEEMATTTSSQHHPSTGSGPGANRESNSTVNKGASGIQQSGTSSFTEPTSIIVDSTKYKTEGLITAGSVNSSLHHHNTETGTSADKNSSTHSQLLVTCGDKEGMLSPEKMAKGIKCIKAKGRWRLPSEFESYGKRGATRNWKTSIFHEGVPLKALIESGKLQCPRKMRRRTSKCGKKRPAVQKNNQETPRVPAQLTLSVCVPLSNVA